MKTIIMLTYIFALALPITSSAQAAEQTTEQASAEQVNIDMIREKYWARGDEAEIGVVQNRLYSKTRKFELGAFGGLITTDPFLSVKSTGASFGFHFNEYFSAHLVGWKAYVAPSTALLTFQDTIGATTNNNPPKSFVGGETMGSLLYGKLSLIGKAILYYDMYLLAGAGYTSTDSGNYFSPLAGIGQKVYVGGRFAVRVDYRLLRYNENIVEKVITPRLGQIVGQRTNYSNSITLGASMLFDFPGGGKAK